MNDILYDQSKMNNNTEEQLRMNTAFQSNLDDAIFSVLASIYDSNENYDSLQDTDLIDSVFRILNCIRRTIIDEIPVITLGNISIDVKTSSDTLAVYNNEYIAQRIHCIPILLSENNNRLYTNKQKLTIEYHSSDGGWAMMTPKNSFRNCNIEMDPNIYNNLPILFIPPYASFKCTVEFVIDQGMSAKYAHAWYKESGAFFVESIGRTPNTREGMNEVINNAIMTLQQKTNSLKNQIPKISSKGQNNILKSEFIFRKTSRSVMNLIVTLFRHVMKKIKFENHQENQNSYMFSVVQPHISISNTFKLLIDLNITDANQIRTFLMNENLYDSSNTSLNTADILGNFLTYVSKWLTELYNIINPKEQE